MSSKLLFAALVTSAVATAPAFAEAPNEEGPSVRVSYAGLDLSNPADAEVVMHRLNIAARTVCGGVPAARSHVLSERAAYLTCHDETLDNAVASAHQPLLTELYEHRREGAPHAVLAAR